MDLVKAFSFLLVAGTVWVQPGLSQSPASPGNPQMEGSYFTAHNIGSAHSITRGAGSRVGVMDHSFHAGAHPELYTGARDFRDPGVASEESHRGYWVALALHEIVPEADIFALGTYSPVEEERVQAMIRALEWAVGEGLDVVACPEGSFSEEAREKLDPAVEEAVASGVVVVFLDYPHPANLLPALAVLPADPHRSSRGAKGKARSGGEESGAPRSADLKVYQEREGRTEEGGILDPFSDHDSGGGSRRYLSRHCLAPVAAGLAALLRSREPSLSAAEIKSILQKSNRPFQVAGAPALQIPDAYEAVRLAGGSPGLIQSLPVLVQSLPGIAPGPFPASGHRNPE